MTQEQAVQPQAANSGRRPPYLIALVGITLAYLLLECAFNARLLDVAGGQADSHAIEKVEFWGRIISGLAVALAEMCIGGRLGAELNLDAVHALQCMNKTELLYSESASRLLVSVKPELAMIFDAFGQWQLCSRVGVVTADSRLTIKSGDSVIANEDVEDLARAFKVTLDW